MPDRGASPPRHLISLVIPIYNEAEAIDHLFAALYLSIDSTWDWEIVVVDDGSRDDSLALLNGFAQRDARVRVISFSRNFGHQAAITAGLDFASGDAAIVMDADLQDPPEILRQMIVLFEQGFDIVSAQRVAREGDGLFKRWTAAGFYWGMRTMVDPRLPAEVGDFRLLSRRAVVGIRQFREQHRFMRGLIAWLGLTEAMVPFHRNSRVAGETKYPLHKMLKFALTAITSSSALPVRVTSTCGFVLTLASFCYFFYAMFQWLRKDTVPGWTSIVGLQCFFAGVTLASIGVVGEYVGKIYEESKARPIYVVAETRNIDLSGLQPPRAIVLPPRS